MLNVDWVATWNMHASSLPVTEALVLPASNTLVWLSSHLELLYDAKMFGASVSITNWA
jgi:hypothetical protein